MSGAIHAIVLGASGYVGGELLRLIAGHEHFELNAAVSNQYSGKRVGELFGHLSQTHHATSFVGREQLLDRVDRGSDVALFSAAPHGAAAQAISSALESGASRNLNMHVVDSSADFRFPDPLKWEAIYREKHGAPELLQYFTSGLPEHSSAVTTPHVGHPGCFATATLLAAIPLIQSELTDAEVFVSGVTGSTGSGRSPAPGTHHPERNSNIYAYKPLAHRHSHEVAALTSGSTGRDTTVHFVPHSGPFARGIHITLQAKTKTPVTDEQLRSVYSDAYANSPFVSVVSATPKLKNVVASNMCHIGVAADGHSVVVMSVIDNLVKGAAGGAVQWMNRLWGFEETSGLTAPAPGWT